MNKIIEKRQLSESVFYMKFEAADIAKNRKAGQFLIVQIDSAPGDGEGQGSLVCCSPWGHKESHMTK